MTPKEAEAKYGKKNLKLMQRYLDGITVSIDSKTNKINIPERDLERAFDMITKGRSNIMWD
jgi:predicted acetyltransferase